jgi:protein-S-isoprenylcysteine O-methyltransferase Ste14
MSDKKSVIPKSCTSGFICIIGLLCFTISLWFINKYDIDNYTGGILSGLAFALPIAILEYIKFKTFKRPSTGLNFALKNKIDIERVVIKLIGLYATLALIAIFYWLFPEYNSGMYESYWRLAKLLLKIIVFGSIPYFFILDRFLIDPRESYWKVGMIVLGKWKGLDFDGLKDFFLGWLVKSFFLPLMFVSLCGNIGFIKENTFSFLSNQFNFPGFFSNMTNYIYTVDLVVVTVGYMLTLRILDSHIRTVEPSFLGWYVALQCYQPFWGALSANYFAYSGAYTWERWQWGYHDLYVLWGILILILLSIYSWASISFGLRFSNLTNRGIITNGPFKFMRHPAYVSKNISWWMVSVPFITNEGFLIGLKHCLLLLLVNFMYFMRAKTEEKHLSKDPAYVAYALAINQTGIFKVFYKIMPFLKYNPDVNKKN